MNFEAHSLRFLTSLHIFKEVTPDRFVNNRVSSLLDSGKPVHDIVAQWVLFPVYPCCYADRSHYVSPERKYDGAQGFSARTGAQSVPYDCNLIL